MDVDHSARYLAQKFYDIKDPDYYEFEGKYTYEQDIFHDQSSGSLSYLKKKIKTNLWTR
jgi:hypothetical protein